MSTVTFFTLVPVTVTLVPEEVTEAWLLRGLVTVPKLTEVPPEMVQVGSS